MPCFCEIPASAARNRFQVGAIPILPPIPLSLKLAAALPALDPENRLDLQIAATLDPMVMPNLDMGGGGLANIAMMLSLMTGAFAIDDETSTVLFRDTLRLDTLDPAEIQGSINALSLALAENAEELLSYRKT